MAISETQRDWCAVFGEESVKNREIILHFSRFTVSLHQGMIRMLITLCLILIGISDTYAQRDTRCMDFLGIPLEGPVDSFVVAMKEKGFTEWGTSDDRLFPW